MPRIETSMAAGILEKYGVGEMSEEEAKEELHKLGSQSFYMEGKDWHLFNKIVEARRILDYLLEEDPRTFKDPYCENENTYDAINAARKELEMAELYVLEEAEKHD